MISFPFVGGEKTIDPESILYVQTEGHRNIFYVADGKKKVQLRIYAKLDDIEKELIPLGFARCHRSCIVNLKRVKSLSNYLMTLDTGEVFSIPRGRYQSVKEQFNNLKGISCN